MSDHDLSDHDPADHDLADHDPAGHLESARAAYARRDWAGARAAFAAAAGQQELPPGDLAADADAAWWLGLVEDSVRVGEQAYRHHLRDGQHRAAALAALTVAVNLLLRGDESPGAGWLNRAQRLLADDTDCGEYGLLRYLVEVEAQLPEVASMPEPAAAAVVAAAAQVRELGHRHGDPDLVALGLTGEGRALVKRGRVPDGLALLDEAMLAVAGGDVSPEWAGSVYCHLMAAAHELVDLRRARDWTDATARWLADLPAAVLFTGVCRLHRCQLQQTTGAWQEAAREADRVCRDLGDLQPESAAEAYYQLGELARLRGEPDRAEQCYQRAHRLGRDPQPGRALVRMARGAVDAAHASICAAVTAEPDRLVRVRLRAAQVEIGLAAGDRATAQEAYDELAGTADRYGSDGLAVMARQAHGALLLHDHRAAEALPVLRDACRRWQQLRAPYDCAKVRMLLAAAYEALADRDSAALERDTAEATFQRLGAAPYRSVPAGGVPAGGDSAGGDRSGGDLSDPPGGLTAREREVLRLVATGYSNRQIATALVISEKTVARHLANIFGKIEVGSRTEAAAFAFRHGLTGPERG